MSDNPRDTQFLGFAKLLCEDIDKALNTEGMEEPITTDKVINSALLTIAQRTYDLVQSACIDINNAQMKQDGRPFHPNAMLRVIKDMTEFPHDRISKGVTMTPEQLAQFFHETYERLAPDYNYQTRKASAVAWENVPDNNKNLMVAVAGEVLKKLKELQP